MQGRKANRKREDRRWCGGTEWQTVVVVRDGRNMCLSWSFEAVRAFGGRDRDTSIEPKKALSSFHSRYPLPYRYHYHCRSHLDQHQVQ